MSSPLVDTLTPAFATAKIGTIRNETHGVRRCSIRSSGEADLADVRGDLGRHGVLTAIEVVDEGLDALAEPARVVERLGRSEQSEHHADDRGLDAGLVQGEPAHDTEGDVGNE